MNCLNRLTTDKLKLKLRGGDKLLKDERKRKMERFRFDDAYGKVYEYDESAAAYIFYGSYFACGIDKSMDYDEAVKAVESGD